MSLPILVTQEKWQALEDQWRASMAEDSVTEVVAALELAGKQKRLARLMGLVNEHVQLLEAGDRHADAAMLIGAALVAGGSPGELSGDLMRTATAAWGGESWFSSYSELTGLKEGAPDLRGPWKGFRKLIAFQKGTLVFHPGGWGAGEVLEVFPATNELTVKFHSGRQDTFPMNAAIDIFTPLPEQELRAQLFRDADGLRKSAKKEPLQVLRSILVTHNGKATTAGIRNAMMGIGIEGSAWSAWWRKARKQAETSEWFEVHGTPAKSTVYLLLEAKDPSVALEKHLRQAVTLADVHAKVRELFVGAGAEDELVAVGLAQLTVRAAEETEPMAERLAAWLLLRDQTNEDPAGMREALEEVLAEEDPTDPSEPPALFALCQQLPGVKDQERAGNLLPDLFGENWLDKVIPHLPHLAPGQVRGVVDKAVAAERGDELLAHYSDLLARPRRAPSLLVTLASMFEEGTDMEGFPTPAQRAMALLNLATHLVDVRRGNPHLTRVSTRLTELLCKGEPQLLKRLLEKADSGALRSANLTIQRGADSDLDHLITEISLGFDRHFYAAQAGQFWESDAIWTTKRGLEKRSLELKDLREVKIPENQEAIGRAAAFGDLSENSEWEAAMEEQRNLTSRAMAIEEELRAADLIEEAALPEGTICPGAKVTYKETESGAERTIVILGPWDDDKWNGIQVVSYRAPLAAGLLGLEAGADAELELPSGSLHIEVIGIETPDLEAAAV